MRIYPKFADPTKDARRTKVQPLSLVLIKINVIMENNDSEDSITYPILNIGKYKIVQTV